MPCCCPTCSAYKGRAWLGLDALPTQQQEHSVMIWPRLLLLQPRHPRHGREGSWEGRDGQRPGVQPYPALGAESAPGGRLLSADTDCNKSPPFWSNKEAAGLTESSSRLTPLQERSHGRPPALGCAFGPKIAFKPVLQSSLQAEMLYLHSARITVCF